MESQGQAVIPTSRVEEGVQAITTSCGKVRESFFELAGHLAYWSKQSEWQDIRQRLIDQKIIGESAIKKFMVAGKNPTLMDPANRKHLPASQYANYYLGGIESKALEQLIEEGTVHPNLSMEECRDLKETTDQPNSSPIKRVSPKSDPLSEWTITVKINKEEGKVRQNGAKVTAALTHLKKTIHSIDPKARVTW